jgi:hypothetical protein
MLTIDLHRLGYRTDGNEDCNYKKGLKGIFKQVKLNSFNVPILVVNDSNKENRVKLILLNLSLL